MPNLPLSAFIALSAARRVFDPAGSLGTATAIATTVTLLGWAALEVTRGVNPFRRALGASIAVVVIVGILVR